ncbi:PREDICTED: late embryogenesis abundant protein At1g64065-like [Ipomoea nil]|uniref:late embryogenesis abundant protein At1g64065-like n=1 Tax=Ipomoea nil TaxID=35883 RepID=UPI000900C097|nr:PREDICTED: late embryogenesis abundant protein At1g64065-like [Ipomoea nil]
MAAKEQVRPLASHRYLHVDVENDDFSLEVKKTRHRHHGKCIKCCGCCTAVLLVVAVAIIVLATTVFHVKDPTIKMNTITIEGLSFLRAGNLNPSVNNNLTLVSEVSVKNPNAASFKFDEAATSLFYDGKVVGEAKIPAGNARARRTLQLNVTVDVMVEKLLEVPRLKSDLVTGELPVAIYTTIHGKVNLLRIVKKSATLKMNCTMSFNILRQDIENLHCLRDISL